MVRLKGKKLLKILFSTRDEIKFKMLTSYSFEIVCPLRYSQFKKKFWLPLPLFQDFQAFVKKKH